MFALGLSIAQVFVPTQATAFATISAADTGRASTMFNAFRQLGGAVGVAVFTSVIVAVGATHRVSGHSVANTSSYRAAFLVAAVVCALAIFAAVRISDDDAADTVPARRRRPTGAQRVPQPVGGPLG
jgi:hypothetical protein